MTGIVFFNHAAIMIGAVTGLLIAASIWAFRSSRRQRSILRIPIRLKSILMGATCLLILAMLGCESLITRSLRPIYSPDRKHAVLILDTDEGALGGTTSVELYSDHGFHADWIYVGEFYTVRPEAVRWTSNSDIQIATATPELCSDARGIHVHCTLPGKK